MLELIRVIIIAIFSGVLTPLPVSASAHFALLNDLLGFSTDENVLAFYVAVFSLVFAVVLVFSLRKIYFNTIKAVFTFNKEKLEQKHLGTYKKLSYNLLLSLIPVALLYIPITDENLLIDYFANFSLPTNLILVGLASIFLGFMMLISFWYTKNANTRTHKISKTSDVVRFSIYQIPTYIIPGMSPVACGVSKLIIRDVNSKTVMREVYTYIAPQMLLISIIQLIRISIEQVSVSPISVIAGVIVMLVISSIIVMLVSKFNIKKLFAFFAVYSIILGAYVITTSLLV